MEEIDIIICLKKEKKRKKIWLFMDLIIYAMFFSHTLLNPQHLCYPYKTNADKSLIMHN